MIQVLTIGAGIAIHSDRRVEYDLEDRKIFRRAQHEDSTHWANAGGTFGGIGEADQGERIEDRNRFGGSGLGRCPGCSLPRGL